MKEQKEIKCLNKGFVRLVDYMGDDSAVVQAARVSYGKGTKSVNEDRGLIRYLMKHKHTSPFEMCSYKFHIKMPIFIARQWIRHRTASVNEYSARYSEVADDFYIPELENINKQSISNKQGRGDKFSNSEATELRQEFMKEVNQDYIDYASKLSKGMARELARINLPLSTYTEWYWKMDLHNLFHFLALRIDPHAQYEIRVYAQAILDIIRDIVPICVEAFEDYVLGATNFSKKEVEMIRMLLSTYNADMSIFDDINTGLSERELKEFYSKLSV